MNPLMRSLISARATAALDSAARLRPLVHEGLKGRFREILIGDLVRPLLPTYCGIGTGTIIDAPGTERRLSEDDLVIFDRDILPQYMLTERDGIFPSESVIHKIEVKSTLTRKGLRDALRAADEMNQLKYMAPPGGPKDVPRVVCTVFAFASDIEGDEMERWVGCVRELGIPSTPLAALCVAGKGMWVYASSEHPDHAKGWAVAPASPDHNEVIAYIGTLWNTIVNTKAKRGQPLWSPYVTDFDRDLSWINDTGLLFP